MTWYNSFFDAPGCGRNAEITDEEKVWVINIACQKPIGFGYAAKTWTYAKLASHINKTVEASEYTRLSTIHKSTVNTIPDEADIRPHKMFVYKQLKMQSDDAEELIVSDGMLVHVQSYDEKPKIQAVAATSPDLMLDKKHPAISRDYEYKRLGTL